jgi:hypothetical protein
LQRLAAGGVARTTPAFGGHLPRERLEG